MRTQSGYDRPLSWHRLLPALCLKIVIKALHYNKMGSTDLHKFSNDSRETAEHSPTKAGREVTIYTRKNNGTNN
jgi:hypothetical protein